MVVYKYYCDEFSYVVTSVLVLTINKYVLSTLHFTLPTVFQGWQTIVCVFILSILLKWSHFRLEIEKLENKKLLRAAIPIFLFTLSGVAGSKALADLPVAVFLAGSNVVPAGIVFSQAHKIGLNHIQTTGSVTLFATACLLYFIYDYYSTGWWWLSVHIVSLILHALTIAPLRISPTTCVYYCNFCSALILLPLSIYLQEAHSAVNHALNAKLEFYIGCVLSGVLGTVVQLLLCRISNGSQVSFYQGVIKILACSMSLICFPNDLNIVAWLLVLTNLVIACFLFLPDDLSESKLSEPLAV